MTIAAELLLAEIVERFAADECAYFSVTGDGAPLLDELRAAPARIAVNPRSGLVRRGGFMAPDRPPSSETEVDDCRRLIGDGFMVIDCLAAEAGEMLEAARRLSPPAAKVLRLRGPLPGDWTPTGAFRLFHGDEAGEERIYADERLFASLPHGLAKQFHSLQIDEFDVLVRRVAARRRFAGLRFHTVGADALFAPTSVVDQPDRRQLTHALGEGRLRFDATGVCALSVPQLSTRPEAIGVVIDGLASAGPDPVASMFTSPDWRLTARRDGGRWIGRFDPHGAAPTMALHLDLRAPGAPEAEVTSVWTGISRRRAEWEDWDEAGAQLELEESW